MMPNWSQTDFQNEPKNDPKMVLKSAPKMVLEIINFLYLGSKMLPKWFQNDSPNGFQNAPKMVFKIAPKMILKMEPFWEAFRDHFWTVLEAEIEPGPK